MPAGLKHGPKPVNLSIENGWEELNYLEYLENEAMERRPLCCYCVHYTGQNMTTNQNYNDSGYCTWKGWIVQPHSSITPAHCGRYTEGKT